MIITDKFVFIHLRKCAGTTVREFLKSAFPNYIRVKPEHRGVSKIPREHCHKLIFGIVRNPLAWYVSFYSDTIARGLFKDLMDREFKEFLRNCFFKETRKLHDINFSKIRKEGIGVYTDSYNRCYEGVNFKSDIQFIKVENLREGLIDFLKLNKQQIDILDGMEKLRTSKHRHYLEYYDHEMIGWIKEMDKKIIKNHNYIIEKGHRDVIFIPEDVRIVE